MAVKFLNGIDVDGSMNIAASDVPNLDASKITSGTLSADRIPNLSGTYQPAGDYLTLETAETSFQPIGNYLTQTDGDARYLQTYDGLQSSHVTGALGYIPYQEGTTLSANTIILANIEKDSINQDGELGWDLNDSAAPASLGTFTGSYPDGLYFNGTSNVYTVYHTGHFSGTNIANWQTAYGWGNHASVGYLTSLPSHNHDTLYDAIGSADAVNARIDNEVFPALDDLGNAIPTNNNQLTNGAGYITSVPAEYLTQTEGDGRYLRLSGGTLYKATNTTGTSGTSFLTLHNNVGSDISQQQSFVDFMFTDGNANFTPQVRIGAQVGRNADANAISKEGAGAFVVYTGNGTDESGGGALSEAMRIGWDNKLIVQGEIQASGYNKTSWDTAFGWGNHASAGYLKSIPSTYATDAEVNSAVGTVNARIDEEVFPALNDLGNAIPTNNNQLTNGAGYYSGSINLMNNDLVMQGSDPGDIVWRDAAGTENHRIWAGSPNYLTYRNNAGSAYAIVHTGLSGYNASNWDTAYGWGNHASAGYATTGYVDTAVSNLVASAPGALNTLNELAAALGDDANFSTTVTNNIAAVNERIDTEVFDAIATVDGNIPTNNNQLTNGAGYLTSLPNNAATFTNNIYLSNSATTANFITELTNLGAFQDNYKAFKVAWSYAGNSNLDVGFESVELAGCLIECWGGTYKHVRLTRPTTGTGGRSIYVYNDQGSSYAPGWRQIWTSDEFSNTNLSNWNTAYSWGNHASAGYLTSIPSSYATDAEVSSAVAAIESSINERIDVEVLPAIDSKLDSTAKAADSNLLDGINSTSFLRSDANDTMSGVLTITGNNGVSKLRLEGTTPTIDLDDADGDSFYIHVNSNNFYILSDRDGGGNYGTWEGPHPLYLEADTNRTYLWGNLVGNAAYASTSDFATSAQGTNADTAYGWGNHASAGYLTSIPSNYVQQTQDIVSGNIHPVGDREQLLGLDSNRWQVVFCEILDSAGQHEKNLQNPQGEKSIGEYETGTVLVWKDGKNIPCTEPADHMRMGIAVQGVASPLIQGAEPVLVTGTVNEGDYLVTSSVEGHAKAISPQFMRQHGLYDCVLGKALENGEGESYLLKTWINI